jgi:predicted DNA-binding transcriptional regulator AlpA
LNGVAAKKGILQMSDVNNRDPLVTRREFCEQGRFGIKTLQRMEVRGEAPAAVEITPGFIRYRQSAIDAWFAARTRTVRPAGKTPTAAIEARHKRRGG